MRALKGAEELWGRTMKDKLGGGQTSKLTEKVWSQSLWWQKSP